MKKIISLILIMTVLFSVSAYCMELEWVSNDRFSSVDIGKNIGLVYNDEGSAIINKFGQIVSPFTENLKRVTPNGLVAVLGDNNYIGFFNNKGEQITEFIYDAFVDTHEKSHVTQVGYLSNMGYRAGDGSSDLLPVSLNNKFGYINSYGSLVIECKYEYAYGFHGPLAMVCADGILSDYGTYTNGKYGFIKETGEEVLAPDSYWVASNFDIQKGYASASNGKNDTVLIDKDGNVFKCDENGFAPASDYIFLSTEDYGRHCVMDKQGNIIVPWVWTYDLIRFSHQRFIYNNEIYNLNNELIFKAPDGCAIFDKISDHDENFIYLKVPHPEIDGYTLISLLDFNGNTVIEPKYQTVLDLGEGLIYARSESENFLFDYNGKLLMKLNGQIDYSFSHNGFFEMRDFDTMKFGIAVNPLVHPKVYIGEDKVKFTDAYPYLKNSRTLVPLRAVFEKMGAEVLWDNDTETVTVKKDNKTISMTVGINVIKVNGKDSEIDISPVLEDDRVYIPLRAFSESLGAEVFWNEDDYTVIIKE